MARPWETEIKVEGRTIVASTKATVLKALQRAGYGHLDGCGCAIGDCGECLFHFKRRNGPPKETDLACITKVEEGMEVLTQPFPWTRAYRLYRKKS